MMNDEDDRSTARDVDPLASYQDFLMPLAEAMTTQRAIRRVKPDPVDDALVLRLIELALKGPTAQNEQGWEFIVVKDPEVKRRLGRQNRVMWRLYRRIAQFKARNDSKEQRMNRAVEWGVDHFEEIPALRRAPLERVVVGSQNAPTARWTSQRKVS